MARNLVFITRYPIDSQPAKVTIYLGDAELGVINMVGNTMPGDMDLKQFREFATETIKEAWPELSEEEVAVVRDFIFQ